MATRVGSSAERLAAVRALRTTKGRREQGRFAFEGATLLAEAVAADFPIAELYATQRAYESTPILRELEAAGTRTFVAPEGAMDRLSDVATPTGIVTVSPIRLRPIEALLLESNPILVLADLNDPANAGTLLRSAEAFGVVAVLFGRLGIDPFHPKVVRGSMGAIFRLGLGTVDPVTLENAARAAGVRVLGLAVGGSPVASERWGSRQALVVGNERHGLGDWQAACERVLSIPMRGAAESLSAGVAGSIALYEATASKPLE